MRSSARQRIFIEYRKLYHEWMELKREAERGLEFGESVANAHRQNELCEAMNALQNCLSKKDVKTLLPTIHCEEWLKVYSK